MNNKDNSNSANNVININKLHQIMTDTHHLADTAWKLINMNNSNISNINTNTSNSKTNNSNNRINNKTKTNNTTHKNPLKKLINTNLTMLLPSIATTT